MGEGLPVAAALGADTSHPPAHSLHFIWFSACLFTHTLTRSSIQHTDRTSWFSASRTSFISLPPRSLVARLLRRPASAVTRQLEAVAPKGALAQRQGSFFTGIQTLAPFR